MSELIQRNPRSVLVAAALIRDAAGRVLLTQRRPGSHQALTWEFPGGKVEPLESPEEALVREIKEELGLTVAALRPWRFVTHRYENFDLVMLIFACGRVAGEPRALEVHAFGWFTPEEMAGLEFPPADLPLVEALSG